RAGPRRILIAARDPTCRNWCGKHFDGIAPCDRATNQLLRIPGKDWLAGNRRDTTRYCWSCNSIPCMISMNTLKTLLYMGSLHGFFTFYFPYQLSLANNSLFELSVFRNLRSEERRVGK